MRKELVKRIVGAFLTLGVNLLVFFITVFLYTSYYQPGNPIRSERIDIDIIGLIGFYIGLSQFIYLIPMILFLKRRNKLDLLRGAILGAFMTILLNVMILLTLVKA